MEKDPSETIDQRQLELPPAWAPSCATTSVRLDRGRMVYESGRARAMANAAIALLKSAREKAVVSSFLLADKGVEDAIFDASQRGVRVYILLASEARLGREESDDEFDKKVLEHHKAMLTRLGGHVLFRSAPHFHAKVVIIDPDTQPAGLLLTANLTTEALERNEELAVALTENEVVEVTAYLKWAMWESAEHELIDPKDRFKATRPLGKVPHPDGGTAIVATTAKAHSIRDEILRLIDEAPSRIIVSSFGWDLDHQVVRRLCERARESLDIIALARIRPASMPALVSLATAGACVLGFRWLHAKAIWTDAGEALVMSANLQADGLDHGFELGVRLLGNRAEELRERLLTWREEAPWKLLPRPRIGDISGAARLWHREQFVGVEVAGALDLDLGTLTASSADSLETPRPALPATGDLPPLAHELRCVWTIAAPVLAPNSKKQRSVGTADEQESTPPIFREPTGRLVVAVKSPDEMEQARTVMAEVGAAAIVVLQEKPR